MLAADAARRRHALVIALAGRGSRGVLGSAELSKVGELRLRRACHIWVSQGKVPPLGNLASHSLVVSNLIGRDGLLVGCNLKRCTKEAKEG